MNSHPQPGMSSLVFKDTLCSSYSATEDCLSILLSVELFFFFPISVYYHTFFYRNTFPLLLLICSLGFPLSNCWPDTVCLYKILLVSTQFQWNWEGSPVILNTNPGSLLVELDKEQFATPQKFWEG